MRRSFVVALVALTLVATGTAAADHVSPREVCDERSGPVLVAVLADGTQLDDEATLYRGTVLDLVLCTDGDPESHGTAWSLDVAGLEEIPTEEHDEHEDYVLRVEVTDDAPDLPAAIEEKDDVGGLTIRVRGRPTYETATGHDMTFPDATTREAYAAAEARFEANRTAIVEAADALNGTSAALENGGDLDPSAVENVASAFERTGDLSADRRGMETQLFAAATRTGDPAAVEAMARLEDREAATHAAARGSLSEYRAALDAATRQARTSVLVNLLGALAAGLVVGAGPGWWLARRKLSDVDYDAQYSSDATASLSHIAFPVALAVFALLASVGLLYVLGGVDPLIEGLP